ncbi:pirin-like C-terminal cupin domain-containing protein (plasmid) [Novosphingobium sp. BL-8A]
MGEPVAARGLFAMKSHEEIDEAIRDYQTGKFYGTASLLNVGI